MRKNVFRHSRAGLSHMAIAGIVAGIAVLGYVGYKWYKNRQNPTSYSQYAPQHQQQRYARQQFPQQFPQQYSQQHQQSPKGIAFAPTTTERDANGQDPELNRLFKATQSAQLKFNAALSSGDSGRCDSARTELATAQAALNAKKQSMY